jgi:hypothetical protein
MILKQLKKDTPETSSSVGPGSTKMYSNPEVGSAMNGNVEYQPSTPTSFC